MLMNGQITVCYDMKSSKYISMKSTDGMIRIDQGVADEMSSDQRI